MPPSDSTFATEYGVESVKTKKLLCPKHAFLSLVVKGRFVSTKSFGFNSGRNLDHQLRNFVGRGSREFTALNKTHMLEHESIVFKQPYGVRALGLYTP